MKGRIVRGGACFFLPTFLCRVRSSKIPDAIGIRLVIIRRKP